MLPDYPIFKKNLEDKLTERVRLISELGNIPFSEIRHQKIFEGTSGALVREDGAKEEIEMHTLSEQMVWRYDEIMTLTPEAVLMQIDKVGQAMGDKKAKMTIAEIDKAVTRIGNVVNAQGGKFGPKHFFEIVRKIIVPFDEFENPIFPTVVAGEKASNDIKRVMAEIDSSDQLKREFSDLLEQKRMEWRDREAARSLVG
jgi:hypothetical protein